MSCLDPRFPQPPARSATCAECGVAMEWHWNGTGVDGQWLDESGSRIGGSSEFATWSELLDHLRKTDMAAYSNLSAQHSLGRILLPGQHWHRADIAPRPPLDVPDCCDWPMQSVRDGWRCRISSTIHSFV